MLDLFILNFVAIIHGSKKGYSVLFKKRKLILEVTLAVWCVPHPNREGGLSQQGPIYQTHPCLYSN